VRDVCFCSEFEHTPHPSDDERELRRIDSRNEARQAWLDEQEPDE
jgi:hypothetical protein